MMNQGWLAVACMSFIACTSTAPGSTSPRADAVVDGFMGGTVTGNAMFVQSGTSVTAMITINNCTDGKSYNVHIHTGPACTDTTTQGGHWDMTRGEGIPPVVCAGTTGTTMTTRTNADPTTAWSIGGDATTDITAGHLIVVHDPDVPMTRIACGPIAFVARPD